jgi:hypothetical protein
MIDAGLAADIHIREFAMKAVAAAHIGVSALRYVEHACDVLRCCERVGAIEWNDKRNRYSYPGRIAPSSLLHRRRVNAQ